MIYGQSWRGGGNMSFRNPMAKAAMNNNPMGNQQTLKPAAMAKTTTAPGWAPVSNPVGDALFPSTSGGGKPPAIRPSAPPAMRPPGGPPANIQRPSQLPIPRIGFSGLTPIPVRPSPEQMGQFLSFIGLPERAKQPASPATMSANPAAISQSSQEMNFQPRPTPIPYTGYRSSMVPARPIPGQSLYNPGGGYGVDGQGIVPGAGIEGPKRENMSPDEYRVLQGGKALYSPADINPNVLQPQSPQTIQNSINNARIARAARMRGVSSSGIDQWRRTSPIAQAIAARQPQMAPAAAPENQFELTSDTPPQINPVQPVQSQTGLQRGIGFGTNALMGAFPIPGPVLTPFFNEGAGLLRRKINGGR